MEDSNNQKYNIGCPVNGNQWSECLNTNDTTNQYSICCTVLCCPIKFPLNLLFSGPCVLYNIFCNKCNNTIDKNYLC